MKKIIAAAALLLASSVALAQGVPQRINYQAVAIDADGDPIPGYDMVGRPIDNAEMDMRLTVLDGSPSGAERFKETHTVRTDAYGLFTLEIGGGTLISGDFATINWADSDRFLRVEMDRFRNGNWTLLGVQKMLTVPYSFIAERALNADFADQAQQAVQSTFARFSDTAFFAATSATANHALSADTSTWAINVINNNDNDADSTNELQALSRSNDTIYLSQGGFVVLPTDQVNDADADSTNELQDLVLNGNTLGLTKSGVTVNLSNLSSGSSGLNQKSFCLSGGQYYDLSSLFTIYDIVNVEAVLQSKILIGCYAPSTGDARFWINRLTGALTPFSIPSSIGYTGFSRHSDNLLYLFGSSSLFVYDVNTGIYLDTIAVSNASGHATVDFKTNKLVYSAGSTTYSYNPVTETQISIPTPTGMSNRLLFIGSDSLYIGATLYNAQNLIALQVNVLPVMSNFVYDYYERKFTFKLSTFISNVSTNVLKTCDRFGGNIQTMSDGIESYSGGGGTVVQLDLKSIINGEVIMKWDGGPGHFVLNNYWLRENTLTWLKMKDNGFVEQITPENVFVGGFDFFQHPKHTVIKLLSNKNCVDNQMVARGIYLFNR
jgi:hypothetical protein